MQRFFLILIPAILFSAFNQSHKTERHQPLNCLEVLDSADVLVQTGEFAIHWKSNKLDKERNLSVSKWFEKRSFSELRCMLESPDKLHNVYGFIFAGMQYADSLKGKYDVLMDDTTSVQYQTPDGLADMKMTVGALLRSMYEQIKEDNRNSSKRPLVEEKVASFIKSYSLYPKTYKPITFPYFSMGSDNKGLTNFSVRHYYQIKNLKGQLVKITSEFVLDLSLNINVIAQDSTSYISSSPPKLSEWLEKYGRQLNQKDSTSLHLR